MKLRRTETMMKNKLAALLSAAAMMLAAFPIATVHADSQAQDVLSDGSFEYVSVKGGYKISKCTATIITEIPSVRNGVAITEIGENAFAGFTGITDLVIPDSVKVIGDNAFYGCTAKTLTLPKNLTSLGNGAFAGCNVIESVTLPDTITEIPDNAFRKCDHIREVRFGSNVTSVGEYAFYDCTSLEKLTLPSTLTTIGDMAFGEMLSLSSIDASKCDAFTEKDGVLTSKDGKDVYLSVSSLEGDCYVPDGTVTIKPGAYSAAAGIENLFLPNTLEEIGTGAFSCQFTGDLGYCSKLKNVTFSNTLKTIGGSAFAFTSIESLKLPTSLETIGAYAFEGSYKLNKVIIPDGVKSIGEKAFFNCKSLKSVVVPKSVSDIGSKAFGFVPSSETTTDDNGNTVREDVRLDGFKMSVTSGSAAKKYAKNNDISYTVTDYDIRRIAFIVLCVALVAGAAVFAVVLISRSRKLASRGARKAKKAEKERIKAQNYRKIIDSDNANDTDGENDDPSSSGDGSNNQYNDEDSSDSE